MGVVASARRAAGTSGTAIVVAGTTVSVSVLGLYISGVGFVGSLGLAAAIVVVVTMISALTLVPGFMGLARETVRALPARVRAHKKGLSAQEQAAATAAATQEQHEHSTFARWGRMVSGRPWPWAAASVAALIVLAIPLFSITLGQPDNGTNPTTDSNRQAYDLISQGFGVGVNDQLMVVVKLPNQSSSANSSLLSTMQSDIAKTAGVASVTPASVNSAGTTAVLNVIPTTRPQAQQTTDLVTTLRDDVLPKQHATSYVTGTTAGSVDFTSQITSRLAWLILAVVLISFLLLTTAFRSVVIATKAAILNILSIGAAYGVIVAIFEWGWGKSLIGLQSTLPVPAYVPMLVFCIVLGLSMDYEVFLLSGCTRPGSTPATRTAAWLSASARQPGSSPRGCDHDSGVHQLRDQPRSDGEDARHRDGVRSADRRLSGPDVPGASIMALLGSHAWWMTAGWNRSYRTYSWKAARRRRLRRASARLTAPPATRLNHLPGSPGLAQA